MKKLVLMLAVAFSATLFSCGGADKKAEAADTVATETVAEEAVVEEAPADSCANCDSCATDSAKAE